MMKFPDRRRLVPAILVLPALGVLAAVSLAPAGGGVRCGNSVAGIVGTSRGETLLGSDRTDIIHGRGGDDVIFGLSQADKVCGGGGTDIIDSGLGSDEVHGGPAIDHIFGNDGNDDLFGDDGPELPRNQISAGGAEIRAGIYGGDGNDEFDGGPDRDLCHGMAGREDKAFRTCEVQRSIERDLP